MEPGPANESRPVGLTILAWLHLLGGSFLALAVLVLFVWLVALGLGKEQPILHGLPVDWLALIATGLLLGVACGLGILRGRKAAWVSCTLFYVLAFCVEAACFFYVPKGATPPLVPAESILRYSIAAFMASGFGLLAGLVALAIYVHLLTGPVRTYFDLGDLPVWKPLVGHLVLGAVIVGPILLLASGKEADRNVVLIQRIGEGRVADEDDVRFLLERLAQGNFEERLSAAWALGRTGRTDALPAVTRSATDDPNPDVRVNAIASLDLLGGETVETALLDFLEDEDEQVRAAALLGLAGSPNAEVVSKVGPLLVDGGGGTRALAVDVLGSSGSPEAIPFLAQAADDPDEDVRSRVAFALGKLRNPGAIPTLVAMLDDERWEVRANAVQALGMIGDLSTRSTVERLTDDPNSMVRQAADATLAKLR